MKTAEEARLDWEKREKKLMNEVAEYGDRCMTVTLSMKEYKESCERLEAEKRILQVRIAEKRGHTIGMEDSIQTRGSASSVELWRYQYVGPFLVPA